MNDNQLRKKIALTHCMDNIPAGFDPLDIECVGHSGASFYSLPSLFHPSCNPLFHRFEAADCDFPLTMYPHDSHLTKCRSGTVSDTSLRPFPTKHLGHRLSCRRSLLPPLFIQTSLISIPYRSRSIFFFISYTRVFVALLLTSSTTSLSKSQSK